MDKLIDNSEMFKEFADKNKQLIDILNNKLKSDDGSDNKVSNKDEPKQCVEDIFKEFLEKIKGSIGESKSVSKGDVVSIVPNETKESSKVKESKPIRSIDDIKKLISEVK